MFKRREEGRRARQRVGEGLGGALDENGLAEVCQKHTQRLAPSNLFHPASRPPPSRTPTKSQVQRNCVQPRRSVGMDLQRLTPNMLRPCDALPPAAVHRGMRSDAPAFE